MRNRFLRPCPPHLFLQPNRYNLLFTYYLPINNLRMKKIFTLFVLLASVLSLSAAPAQRGLWRTIRLADGTERRARLCGDEFMHYLRDAAGQRYRYDSTTAAYVPIADFSTLTTKAAGRRQRVARARAARRSATRAVLGAAHQVYAGTKRGLIILVEFKDKQFAQGHDNALFQRIANEEGYQSADGFRGSVRDYFKSQSAGQFVIDFDVVGPVQLPQNCSYYGGNDADGNDRHPAQMVATACRLADAETDFSRYDWDGDGAADEVYILYAGEGENANGGEETVWPHQSELSYNGLQLKLDGVMIDTYACSAELSSAAQINGIGTLCHEFSHCLGLPDMYDVTYQGGYGMQNWDVMDQGSYNGDANGDGYGDGMVPAAYTAYERMYAGWLTPRELTADTLISSMRPLTDGGEAYIIYNKVHRDEFYLLENRQQTGWDAQLYGAGLLAVHVDYDAVAWRSNNVNSTNDHQRCTPVAADNSYNTVFTQEMEEYLDAGDIGADAYPCASNDSLTRHSQPAAALYAANADHTRFLNAKILHIRQHKDLSMSFEFKTDSATVEPSDSVKTGRYTFYETFDQCNGTGGNDDIWSGSTAQSSFLPDNDGWALAYYPAGTAMYGANKCARFGTGTKDGSVITPAFSADGVTTFSFMAAPWSRETTDIILTVQSGTATLGTETFSLTPGKWTSCTTTFKGSGTVRILFTGSKMRFFLDDVRAVKTVANGIRQLPSPAVMPSAGRIYNLNGQYVGTRLQSLPKGVYIMNGRKVVK